MRVFSASTPFLLSLTLASSSFAGLSPPRRRRPRWPAARGREVRIFLLFFCSFSFSNKIDLGVPRWSSLLEIDPLLRLCAPREDGGRRHGLVQAWMPAVQGKGRAYCADLLRDVPAQGPWAAPGRREALLHGRHHEDPRLRRRGPVPLELPSGAPASPELPSCAPASARASSPTHALCSTKCPSATSSPTTPCCLATPPRGTWPTRGCFSTRCLSGTWPPGTSDWPGTPAPATWKRQGGCSPDAGSAPVVRLWKPAKVSVVEPCASAAAFWSCGRTEAKFWNATARGGPALLGLSLDMGHGESFGVVLLWLEHDAAGEGNVELLQPRKLCLSSLELQIHEKNQCFDAVNLCYLHQLHQLFEATADLLLPPVLGMLTLLPFISWRSLILSVGQLSMESRARNV